LVAKFGKPGDKINAPGENEGKHKKRKNLITAYPHRPMCPDQIYLLAIMGVLMHDDCLFLA
jgi:hypothetical protein